MPSPVEFQPYAFLMDGSHPSCVESGMSSWEDRSSYGNTPADVATPSAGSAPEGMPGSEHAPYLQGQLEYIVPPTLNAVERETPANARCLFLGHMRFETTAAEVRWLVRRTTGVTPMKAETRGNGCYVVYLANEAEEAAVRTLHKRMLFDHEGVWFARNEKETQTLCDYVDHVLARGRRGARPLRLPKDCLVVEDPRSKAAPKTAAPSPPTYYQSQRHPQQPQQPRPYGFHGSQVPEYVLPDYHESVSASPPPPPPYDAAMVSA